MEVYRDAEEARKALGPQPSDKQGQQIYAQLQQEMAVVRTRYFQTLYIPTAPDALGMILADGPSCWPPSDREMDQGFVEFLHWRRFDEPLWIDLRKENAGDMSALKRILRTTEDHERIRFRKGIKPAQGDPEHALLFEVGLDLGLSALTAEELADCFEAICPCGKEHDADALKKQRFRKQKALQKAASWFGSKSRPADARS